MSDLYEGEINDSFLSKMKAAMYVSFYKYGPIRDAYPHKVDAIASLLLRLEKYKETGNTEYLIDVANFAMIEFTLPKHPNAFYKATDSEGSPGRVIRHEVYDKPNQYKNSDLLEHDEKV
jgi:hypothetical protein